MLFGAFAIVLFGGVPPPGAKTRWLGRDRRTLANCVKNSKVWLFDPACDMIVWAPTEAWNTAIDFVANQSSKLKLIREKEYYDRERELRDKSEEASQKYLALQFSSNTPGVAAPPAVAAQKAWEEAREISSKYSAAPQLSLIVETLEQKERCFGTLSASVTAMLTSSKMISTGNAVGYHSWEIWNRSSLLVGPTNTFSRFVIQSSEEMMKSFVNDWALSQRDAD